VKDFEDQILYFIDKYGYIDFFGRWIFLPTNDFFRLLIASLIIQSMLITSTLKLSYSDAVYIAIPIDIISFIVSLRVLFKEGFTRSYFLINFLISKDRQLYIEITKTRPDERGDFPSRRVPISQLENLHPKNIQILKKKILKKLKYASTNQKNLTDISDKIAFKREISTIHNL